MMNEKSQGIQKNNAVEVDFFNEDLSNSLYSGPESLIQNNNHSEKMDNNPFANMTDDHWFD